MAAIYRPLCTYVNTLQRLPFHLSVEISAHEDIITICVKGGRICVDAGGTDT